MNKIINFKSYIKKGKLVRASNRVKYLSSPLFKGINTESFKLAEDIYSWHIKIQLNQLIFLHLGQGLI